MTTRALKSKASDISRIARSHGVSRVRVFGSHAAGRAKRTSDVDLLITLQSNRDLFDLVEFKLDIQDLLGCDVDVVTENGLSPYLRRTILRTAKPLRKMCPLIIRSLIAQYDLTDHGLTEEQEVGNLASLAELNADAGITLADAIETIKRGLGRF